MPKYDFNLKNNSELNEHDKNQEILQCISNFNADISSAILDNDSGKYEDIIKSFNTSLKVLMKKNGYDGDLQIKYNSDEYNNTINYFLDIIYSITNILSNFDNNGLKIPNSLIETTVNNLNVILNEYNKIMLSVCEFETNLNNLMTISNIETIRKEPDNNDLELGKREK